MTEPLFDLEPPAPEPAEAAVKLTERDMLDLLHKRFSMQSQGLGDRYVRAEHVRARAGFDCRTADFVAMDMWRSSLAIHGVEVKVSRSDWLRELKQPEKSAPFREWCTHWWLAVPDAAIVQPGELPEGWGLLVAQGVKSLRLVAKVEAPRKDWALTASGTAPSLYPHSLALIPVEVMAALLRAAAKTATARAYREGVQAGRAFASQKAAADG